MNTNTYAVAFSKKNIPGKGCIEAVAVAPYEPAKQWQFAQYYFECRNEIESLQFYRGGEFDVLLLSIPYLRKRSIHYGDLRSYIAENSIPKSPTLLKLALR